VLTPSQKGSIAEAAIVAAAIKLGISVFKPINEGLRYDLVFELRERFFRVQCKWIVRRRDMLVVPFVSRRRCADGFLQKRYTQREVDAFAGYSAELDRCYYLPFDRFPQARAVSLRLGPTQNNQQRGINWAEEYEFGATLGTLGAIAQLGERVHGMHEVAGSSPAGSTESRSRERLFA
jgi:hypothetical protein